ncbi:MAG: hypothetical protein KDI36_17910, partial [Pseudomonadales bacterium]|nr:hypothetical protein [Pseudomonadales bacterium]
FWSAEPATFQLIRSELMQLRRKLEKISSETPVNVGFEVFEGKAPDSRQPITTHLIDTRV